MSRPVKPIAPAEVTGAKKKSIPSAVLEGFNELIAESWNGSQACFTQDEVITRILSKGDTLTRQGLFVSGHLDVEPIYEAEGWRVEYDKPGYNETYSTTFTFKKKRSRA